LTPDWACSIARAHFTRRIAMQLETMPMLSIVAFSKDAFPTAGIPDRRTLHLACRNKPSSLA